MTTAVLGAALRSPASIPPDGRVQVGVADMAVATDAAIEIVTHALGSCIGITVWDPEIRVGGMLHFMLPTGSPEKAASNPAMFGDTGIPLLFKSLYAMGAVKERLVVCAAGGAEVLQDDNTFRVGTKNRTLLRKIFWTNSVLLAAEDTGGNNARTMHLSLSDGRVEIRSQGKVRVLWPE
jgi:chemotaxis protein CheD